MGYFSCNADSAIATCDPQSWELIKKHKKNSRKKLTEPFEIKRFSYADLHAATNGFSGNSFLGKGSHGSVYEAVFDNGKLVAAVKKTMAATLDRNCITSPADNEIEILSHVRSPRLVNLLGFCLDSERRKFIVVEFMPNGSLYDLIHARARPPGWGKRIRFALQVSRAVQHLHLSNPPVIHRDIKSSNVLIDGDWNARLGDFGLALRGHVEDVRVKCTPPAGTLGYLDPGYLAPGDLSAKSDVFSFGILLLEMISGRKAIDMNHSPPSVVDWAAPLIKAGDYAGICDPRIAPPEDASVVRQLAVLAARCVRAAAEKRPPISDVVDCLKSVYRRVKSPVLNNLGRRVAQCVKNPSPSIKYEPLDDSIEIMKGYCRAGSRGNRKVSGVSVVESVMETVCLSDSDGVGRSKSVGSVREMKLGPLDSNFSTCNQQVGVVRRRAGLAVKVPTVRLNKSRSMGMSRSSRFGENNGFVLQIKRNSDGGELEESKLLIKLEERSFEG